MQTGSFKTSDGFRLHTVSWPTEQPKAAVIIVHGIAEHSGRYQHVAEYLNQHDISVYALDHRSHGQSEGTTRTHFERFDEAVTDLKHYYDMVSEQVHATRPDLPIFLYGHSMGALISTLFVLQYQDLLAGFISSGIPLHLDKAASPVTVWFGLLGARVLPRLRFFPVVPQTISSLPAEVERYLADPLIDTRPARLGMAGKIITAARDARQKLDQITLPLFVFHGSSDLLSPPSGSQALYDQSSSQDKTLKFYAGMRHETHNDQSRAEVLADVARWISERA